MFGRIKTLFSATLVALIFSPSGILYASIVNGGFETGDLAGWSASPSALVSVTTGPVGKLAEVGVWTPSEGNYFAYLLAGNGADVYTLLSQVFSAASGSTLSFNVFYDAGDYFPFLDDGYVNLIDVGSSTSYPLYAKSIADVGSFGSDGWRTISFPIPSTGNFRIEAGIRNTSDNAVPSSLGLDNVRLTDSGVVPEASSLIIWGILVSVSLVHSRRAPRADV